MAAKTDRAHGFFKWMDYNRYLVAGIVLSIIVAFLFTACVPKTTSLLKPPAQVTDAQLQVELVEIQGNYDTLLKKAEVAQADLEAQYAFRAKLVDAIGSGVTLLAGGTLTPTSGAAAGLQLFTLLGGIGLIADNRRKDAVISSRKTTATVTQG